MCVCSYDDDLQELSQNCLQLRAATCMHRSEHACPEGAQHARTLQSPPLPAAVRLIHTPLSDLPSMPLFHVLLLPCRGDLTETPYTHLYHGSSGPALNLTLEGQLLSQWSSGRPHYDALFLQEVPPVDQLLTSFSGEGPAFTLLVNQSAVSGLPASLNQATSALLRLMVAAGGAKSSPAPSAGLTPGPSLPIPAAAGSSSSPLGRWAEGGLLAAGAGARQNSSSSSSIGRSGRRTRRLGTAQQTAASRQPSDSSYSSGGSSSSWGGSNPGGGHLPSCMPVINTVSSPLPLMQGEKAQRVRQDAGALMLVLCMTLAASVLSASFVVFLVRWVGKEWRTTAARA